MEASISRGEKEKVGKRGKERENGKSTRKDRAGYEGKKIGGE